MGGFSAAVGYSGDFPHLLIGTDSTGVIAWILAGVFLLSGVLKLRQPVLGGLIYGAYGFVRGWSVWLQPIGLLDHMLVVEPDTWLIKHYGAARSLAARHLLIVTVAVVIAVGF